jgi:hypothetical protein
LVSDNRGRTGAFVEANPGPRTLLGFLLRRRRRLPEDEEPAFEDISDSSNLRRRPSIIPSFDMPLGRFSIVFVGVVSLVDILNS